MWKLKDDAEGRSKVENAKLMKEKLESMPPLIPELESVEVGIHMFDGGGDAICDLVLLAKCKNEENLHAYAAHPEHKKVVEFILKVVSERRVVDYIID
jgi:hypothetical protein